MGPHDLDAFRHQMSNYLSNALTNNVNGSGTNTDRSPLPVPAPHYLPFIMGHLDEKVLSRLPGAATANPNFGLLYHHHPGHQQHSTSLNNVNISSASPTSSSNSSGSDIHESSSGYLSRFDDTRRMKLELQDTTAWPNKKKHSFVVGFAFSIIFLQLSSFDFVLVFASILHSACTVDVSVLFFKNIQPNHLYSMT